MQYHHNFNDRKRRRFIHRIEFFIGLAILLIISVGIFMLVTATRDENINQPDQASSSSTTGYYAANVQIFRTPYFQFQSDKTWSEATNESKDGKYVYRSLRNGLIKHEFVVYTGKSIPATKPVTRVLPVTIATENTLKANAISEHCNNALPVGQKGGIKTVTYQNVTFDCFGDNTQYNVIVGQIGGTPKLNLLRPDGAKETYVIYYSNVTANPESSQLQQIIASFQTR